MTYLKKLYQEFDKRLTDTDYIQKAYTSALYHERWKKSKLDISKLKGYKDLKQLPFTSAEDLR
ncbi:MAG: hypothetical protein ACTSSH_03305, partial [Candidatus Heimdallarchaeota archaeon]